MYDCILFLINWPFIKSTSLKKIFKKSWRYTRENSPGSPKYKYITLVGALNDNCSRWAMVLVGLASLSVSLMCCLDGNLL